jgi:pyruvyl transferase EpsO
LRETLLERYRGVKAIVLPQSVQFSDHAQMKAAARAFGDHGDATVYVRDVESLKFVTERALIPGEIMPDMAHFLWDDASASPHHHQTGSGVLVQTRNDSEGRGVRPEGDVFDWDDVVSSTDRLGYYAYAAWRRLSPAPRTVPTYRAWYAIRDRVVRKGIEPFQTAAFVKTDRLHGVILAALLNKRVHFDDRQNTYRKLHRYHQSWLSDSPLITAA